jgi:hypothetical protein
MTAMPIETKQRQQETTPEPSDLEFETTKLSIVKAGLEEIKNNKNPIWHSTTDMDNWFNAQRQSIK